MYFRLDRSDVRLAQAEGLTFFQVDDRPAAEIQRQEELSILFVLTRVLGPLSAGVTGEVFYVCSHEQPPDFLWRAVAASGGKLQVQKGPPLAYEGVPVPPEDLADEAFRRLAHRVLRERNAALDEHLLEALLGELPPIPVKEEDELPFWTRFVELSALLGEMLRAKYGGRWVTAPRLALVPFAFRLGIENGPRYILNNVVGKLEKFLENGAPAGAVGLLRSAEEHEPPGTALRPVHLMLKPAHWPGRHGAVCQPLATWRDPRVALPWVAYGEQLPDSFNPLLQASLKEGAFEALHAQALEHLKAIALEPRELVQGAFELRVVLGQPYAAEKLLDAGFVRSLHERLRSPALLAGIPRRGFLFVMSARVEPRLLKFFLDFCKEQDKRGDSEPLCSTPLLIEDGKISGFLWASPKGEPKLVRAAELNTEPPRGLFNRLLARVRS